MRAIETEYNGVLFRSRLEARWAVFFDALGLRWEYEPEGYELADGTRYLPDFSVLGGAAFVEIKPAGDPFIKARKFAAECGKPVWLCAGEPSTRPWRLLQAETRVDEGGASSTEVIEQEIVYHPWKDDHGRVWYLPSDTEAEDYSGAAVARVRAHRFWNPRRFA